MQKKKEFVMQFVLSCTTNIFSKIGLLSSIGELGLDIIHRDMYNSQSDSIFKYRTPQNSFAITQYGSRTGLVTTLILSYFK